MLRILINSFFFCQMSDCTRSFVSQYKIIACVFMPFFGVRTKISRRSVINSDDTFSIVLARKKLSIIFFFSSTSELRPEWWKLAQCFLGRIKGLNFFFQFFFKLVWILRKFVMKHVYFREAGKTILKSYFAKLMKIKFNWNFNVI